VQEKKYIKSIAPGDILERQLIDGDIVIFNRQPSLHRINIMAHKVRILPGKTFRLNFDATHPYGADFDGDEMNLHVPQTLEAQAEAKYLMWVNNQIFSPRTGDAIITNNEDGITGMYLLTEDTTRLTKKEASYLLALAGIYELPKPGKDGLYAGKDIFSMLLPSNLISNKGKGPDSKDCKRQACRGCYYKRDLWQGKQATRKDCGRFRHACGKRFS